MADQGKGGIAWTESMNVSCFCRLCKEISPGDSLAARTGKCLKCGHTGTLERVRIARLEWPEDLRVRDYPQGRRE